MKRFCKAGLVPFVLMMGVFGKAAFGQQSANPAPEAKYDLLILRGHVVDVKNHIDGIRDVGISKGVIAEVGEHLDEKDATKIVDATGMWVTPGLIDIHAHVYAGTGEKNSLAGDESVYPDGFTFRVGVTTVVDAGGSGWRNFEDFKQRVIDRSKTRVLADINIVGAGMRGPKFENNLDDMSGELTGKMALKYPGIIVGVKTAHYQGPEWLPYDESEKAAQMANIPVMIDYGANRPERPLYDLMTKKLERGDIYTHCYSGLRGEQDPVTGGPSKAMIEGRARGIYCDVGHGSGSFLWNVAAPMVKAGYVPDSISTDLHFESMNLGMKDILNVADKFLALGETVPQLIQQMTWNPAREIRQEQLGNLSPGAVADVAVLSIQQGQFGFIDTRNMKLMGDRKLVCELTVRAGKVVYDLNGLAATPWDRTKAPGYRPKE